MATLEREDRLQTEEFKKAKRSLPRLRKRRSVLLRKTRSTPLRDCLGEQEELATLNRQIRDIESDRAQTDYLCNLSTLIRTHTTQVNQEKERASKQWEEEMSGQSMAIHTRQQRAGNVLWDRRVTIRFVGNPGLPDQPYQIHVNTTLPQLSQMVHQITTSAGLPDDYFPLTYNFWIVNPDMRDPFRHKTVAEWVELLDKKRTAYDEMLPIQTSIGEALFYDGGHQSLETYLDNLKIPFLCILMAPRTAAEWRIPQRATANLERVDQYVTNRRRKEDNPFSQKGALFQKYMEMIGKREAPRRRLYMEGNICPECNMSMVKVESESKMVCAHCGISEEYLDNSIRNLPFGHEINATSSTYKRINHFNEWLSQLQAKERTEIPEEVVALVTKECCKRRMNMADVTPKRVRKFLGNLGRQYAKYYEHSAQIAYRISGIPPLNMTMEQEERLRVRFRQAQCPFDEMPRSIKGRNRKNFLSYGYFLRKTCELLGYDEFLPTFPLLKSPQKIYHHDRMWKYICDMLGWQPIPTGIEDDSR